MKIYLVGGAVRDKIMGVPTKDKDYLVVGSTPEEMISLGYRPVGKSFPVFHHPETNAEYALARTEKKTAKGYHGFKFFTSPDISLEEDLSRRDLTINAIAMDDSGVIYDPFNGVEDIKNKIIRHVSKAFEEDPLRVLRVARFKARFNNFSINHETKKIMRKIVLKNEMESLSSERILVEILKGCKENDPLSMLEVLSESGALERIMPLEFLKHKNELSILYGLAEYKKLSAEESLIVTMMVSNFFDSQITQSFDPAIKKIKLSSNGKKIAELINKYNNKLIDFPGMSKNNQLDCCYLFDFFRRPNLMITALSLINCTLIAHQGKFRDYINTVTKLNKFKDLIISNKPIINGSINIGEIAEKIYKDRLTLLCSIN